jgi:hypothetical protein
LSVLPQPQPTKRTRNGKIAHLPYLERDMVNRMLRDRVRKHAGKMGMDGLGVGYGPHGASWAVMVLEESSLLIGESV